MQRISVLVMALFLAVGLTGTAFAQTQTGTITGRVTDPDGAPLPGATVTIESDALIQGSQSRITGPGGGYTFVSLPVGAYTVRIALDGFRTVEVTEVRLTIGFVATVDAQMELATVAETITVTGESPVVDVKSNVKSVSFSEQILENVPSGRHVWSVGEMMPGVTPSNFDVGGTEGMQQYSIEAHGSSDDQKSFNVDGLKLNWPGGVGGGATMMYYDFSAFEEIAFQTNNLPAEVQAGGVYMNMVTGSGGNDFHYDGYAYWANESLQGDNVEGDAELQARGATFGNPLDVSYDLNGTVGGPIVRNRAWFFGGARWWRVDKVRLGIINPDGNPAVDDNRIRNLYAKGTWQLDPDNKLSVGFNNNWKDRFHRQDRGWFTFEEATVLQDQPAHSVQGQWTSVISDSTFLDARLGRMWGVFPLRYQDGVGADDIAIEDVGTRERRGAAPGGEFENPNDRTQVNVALSHFEDDLAGGYHDFKLGAQFSDQTMERTWRQNGDILWRLNDSVPLEVVVVNTPVDAIAKLRDWGLYGQDNWTIAERVTLNLGLRASSVRGWLPAQTSPAGNFVGARDFDEIDDVPDLDVELAPRIGFSVDVFGNGRTALKGGYSRYYDQFGAGIAENFNPNGRSTGTRAWDDINGDMIPQEGELGPFQGFATGGVNRRLDPDLRTPYEDELTIGVDHQLTELMAVGVMVFHRRSRDQWGTLNVARPSSAYTQTTVADPFTGADLTVWDLDPAFVGLVDNLTTSVDLLDVDYNGVELTLERRWSDDWQLMGGLTLGRSEGGIGGFGTDFNNPNNLINQQGRISNDSTYIFKLVGSYRAPYDVQIAGNYRLLNGYPLNRNLVVTGLNQGSETIRVVERGEFRLEDVSILDLRFGKVFDVQQGSVEVSLDLYNVLNSNAVLGEVETIGGSLGDVSQVVAPILVRFGAAVRF